MNKRPYPTPREDADNAAFLASWRKVELLLQRCSDCGKSIFYPRPVCPHCWSQRLESRKASGNGRIVSYSLVQRPNDAAFNDEVPIILVEVALEEGALLLARVVGCDPATVKSGLTVKLPPADVCARYPLPVFHLAEAE